MGVSVPVSPARHLFGVKLKVQSDEQTRGQVIKTIILRETRMKLREFRVSELVIWNNKWQKNTT